MARDDLSGLKPADVRAALNEWLAGEGWTTSEITSPDAHWVLRAESQNLPIVLLALKKNPSDQIVIQGTVAVAPEHLGPFSRLPEPRRTEILSNIKIELLRLGVDFNGLTDPPGTIGVLTTIYLGGLTKNIFFRPFTNVKNGIFLIIWTIAKELGAPSPTGVRHQEPMH